MTLSDFLQQHLARKGADMAPQTKLELARALQRMLDYFDDIPLGMISHADVARYAAWLYGNYSDPTARLSVQAAEEALAAYREEVELSREEVNRLIESVEDMELKSLIILLARYGLRLSEALSLHTQHVGKKDRSLVYRSATTRYFVALKMEEMDAACLRDLARVRKRQPLFLTSKSTLWGKMYGHATVLGFAGKLKGFASLRRYFQRVVLRERRKGGRP